MLCCPVAKLTQLITEQDEILAFSFWYGIVFFILYWIAQYTSKIIDYDKMNNDDAAHATQQQDDADSDADGAEEVRCLFKYHIC